MHRQSLATAILLFLLSGTTTAKLFSRSKDAILLSNVRSLTVHADRQTSHRRVPSIPQLTCKGGSGRGLYNVDVMRCQNSGAEYDPEDIQWTCKAALPPEFKLGATEVVCEGYDSADDPYVLKGSCGVEYRLVLTELGEQKYGKRAEDRSFFDRADDSLGVTKGLTGVWKVLFWIVFFVVLYTILEKLYSAFMGNAGGPGRRPRGGWGGGWGGGGGGDGGDDDPPPPYSRRSPPKRSTYSSSSRGYGPSWMGGGGNNGNAWQPGFWTGLATGAGAGYFAGNRAGSSSREPRRNYGGGGAFGGGSQAPWGGGGGSGSSSFAGPSSSRHESTGFGGTRRR